MAIPPEFLHKHAATTARAAFPPHTEAPWRTCRRCHKPAIVAMLTYVISPSTATRDAARNGPDLTPPYPINRPTWSLAGCATSHGSFEVAVRSRRGRCGGGVAALVRAALGWRPSSSPSASEFLEPNKNQPALERARSEQVQLAKRLEAAREQIRASEEAYRAKLLEYASEHQRRAGGGSNQGAAQGQDALQDLLASYQAKERGLVGQVEALEQRESAAVRKNRLLYEQFVIL